MFSFTSTKQFHIPLSAYISLCLVIHQHLKVNMSEKNEVTQTENGTAPRKNRTCARHCKRFWWVHLIILCVIVVIVVPVM